jgi:hypothetical protein
MTRVQIRRQTRHPSTTATATATATPTAIWSPESETPDGPPNKRTPANRPRP